MNASWFRNAEDGVAALVAYALDRQLIGEEDIVFASNQLFDALHYEPQATFEPIQCHSTGGKASARGAFGMLARRCCCSRSY